MATVQKGQLMFKTLMSKSLTSIAEVGFSNLISPYVLRIKHLFLCSKRTYMIYVKGLLYVLGSLGYRIDVFVILPLDQSR